MGRESRLQNNQGFTGMGGNVLEIPVSPGEVADRISILEIKSARLASPAERAEAAQRKAMLLSRLAALGSVAPEHATRLLHTNEALWAAEDDLRDHEAREDFGEHFVALARSIYRLNDERHRIKAAIDAGFGVTGEPKEHPAY
jgi:hypothetical protein